MVRNYDAANAIDSCISDIIHAPLYRSLVNIENLYCNTVVGIQDFVK
jgi:hypothetical protein